MATERWSTRHCEACDLLWPLQITLCHFCARRLDLTTIDVVRAAGARSADPDTSKLAALGQAPRSGSQRGRILDYLRTSGPKTSREIEESLGIKGAWKRVSELKQGGHIHEVETVYDYTTRTDVTVYAAGPEPAAVEKLF